MVVVREGKGGRKGRCKFSYGRRDGPTPQCPQTNSLRLTVTPSHHRCCRGLINGAAPWTSLFYQHSCFFSPGKMSHSASDTASSVGSIIEQASEPDTTAFKCLFCEQQWQRVPEMFAHCRADHGFDAEETIKTLGPGASFDFP